MRIERKRFECVGDEDEGAGGGDLRAGAGVQCIAVCAAGGGPVAEEERCGDFAADLWRVQRTAGGGDCAWGLSAGPIADSGNGGELADVRERNGADDYLQIEEDEGGENGGLRVVVSQVTKARPGASGVAAIIGLLCCHD